MSDEIKLNEWRWGVVPELHPHAVVGLGGTGEKPRCDWCLCKGMHLAPSSKSMQWYCILSTEPPKMPATELRLPDGWEVADDEELTHKEWLMSVERYIDGDLKDSYTVYRPTRRECVEEINRILGGR